MLSTYSKPRSRIRIVFWIGYKTFLYIAKGSVISMNDNFEENNESVSEDSNKESVPEKDGIVIKKVYKLKIIYNKNGCKAAGHCVLSDPYNWVLDEEFKADLKDSKETIKGIFVK